MSRCGSEEKLKEEEIRETREHIHTHTYMYVHMDSCSGSMSQYFYTRFQILTALTVGKQQLSPRDGPVAYVRIRLVLSKIFGSNPCHNRTTWVCHQNSSCSLGSQVQCVHCFTDKLKAKRPGQTKARGPHIAH